jgi:hypothetical protein
MLLNSRLSDGSAAHFFSIAQTIVKDVAEAARMHAATRVGILPQHCSSPFVSGRPGRNGRQKASDPQVCAEKLLKRG